MNKIEKLSQWEYPNTKLIPDGYDQRLIPEATPDNMEIMMDKINELIETVNELTATLNRLKE